MRWYQSIFIEEIYKKHFVEVEPSMEFGILQLEYC